MQLFDMVLPSQNSANTVSMEGDMSLLGTITQPQHVALKQELLLDMKLSFDPGCKKY